MQSQISNAIGLLPGPVAAIGAVGIAVAGTLFAVGESFEGAFRKIRSNTGATEEQMTGLESSFKRVLASGPSSMGAVADALSLVSQRTHLVGADLEGLTQAELRLARVTKTDVKETTDATTKALANFGIVGIGPSKLALDELLHVSQQTGVGINSLADLATGKAGATFRALGLDIGQTASILGNLQAAGVATGPVIMGLSKAVTEAQKSGKDAKTAIADLFNTILNGTPGTAAYEDAIKSLGTRGFQSLRDAIQTGKISLDDFTRGMSDQAGLIDRVARQNMSLGVVFDTIKNKAMVALSGAGEAVAGFALTVAQKIPGAMDAAGDAVSNFWTGLTQNDPGDTWLGKLGALVHGVLAPALRGVRDVAVDVFGTLVTGWQAFLSAFQGEGITSDGIIGVFERLGVGAREVIGELTQDWQDFVGAFNGSNARDSGWLGWFEDFGRDARTAIDGVRDGWSQLVAGFEGRNVVGPLAEVGRIASEVADFFERNWKPILIGAGVALALLISPIATVTAGLIVLYQRSETFREGVRGVVEYIADHWQPALEHVSDALDDVGRFMSDHVVPALAYLRDEVGDFASFFIDRWDKISVALQNVGRVIEIAIVVPIAAVVETAMFIWDHFGEQIVAVLQFAWNEVGSILNAAVRIVSDVFDFIISILSGNWGDAWGDVVDVVEAAIGLVRDTIWNGLTLAVSFFASLPGNILSAVGDIAGRLAPLAVSLLVWFAELPGRIVVALGSLALHLIEWAGRGFVELAAALPRLLGFMAGFWATLPLKILELIGKVDVWLVAKGAELIAGLVEGLVSALPAIGSWFADLPGRLAGFASSAGTWLLHVGDVALHGLLSGMTGGWSAVSSWFADLPGRLASAAGDAGSWLVHVGEQALSGLADGLRAGSPVIYNFMTSLPGRLLDLLGDAGSWLVDVGGSVLSGLLDGLETAVPDVLSWMAGLPGEILDGLGDLGSLLLDAGLALLTGLIDGLENEVPTVLEWFVQLPIKILTSIPGFELTLLQKGVDLLVGLLTGLDSKVGDVMTWFLGMPDTILGWLERLPDLLIGYGSSMLYGLIKGLASMWENLKSWFTSLPGEILGWIGDLAGKLYDLGKHALERLKDGIVDAAKGIGGAIGGAAGSVAGAIADLLPGSPVKKGPLTVLNDGYAGKQIMRMLVSGITAEGGVVAAAMKGALGTAVPQMPNLGTPTQRAAAAVPVPQAAQRLANASPLGGPLDEVPRNLLTQRPQPPPDTGGGAQNLSTLVSLVEKLSTSLASAPRADVTLKIDEHSSLTHEMEQAGYKLGHALTAGASAMGG